MERDFLKRYVDEHKNAFENEALPPNMLGNILANLEERKKHGESGERGELKNIQAQKTPKLTYTWLAVACSIFMVAGAYLFTSQEAETVANTATQIALKHEESTVQPTVVKQESKAIKPRNTTKNIQIAKVNHHPKVNIESEIYTGLSDSSSVANRLNALIKASAIGTLNDKMKTELCRTFNEDNNDNVRLAALEVLSKFSTDKYIQEHLVASLSKQKDPMVQLELVKIVGNNSNPETTEKLIAMANNPFTVDAVKEQVHYALLTNNN
ncbi:MAG: HEAT repeat domain-containing protein [Flavobacteriales bacterium]|nr:MAG: HEAT repeat domain-containing protein [Flavobacteriales bacterium]